MEMNIHCAQSLQTLEELRQLTLVPTQMISPGKSSPVLYLVQDTLLGGYLMTQDSVKLTKNEIHNLSKELIEEKLKAKALAEGKSVSYTHLTLPTKRIV